MTSYRFGVATEGLYFAYTSLMDPEGWGEGHGGLANSLYDGFNEHWESAWPEVGGGGDSDLGLNTDQLFDRMCAWEDAGYMMSCSMGHYHKDDPFEDDPDPQGAGADGLVDCHAYSIISVANDVEGGDGNTFDMIQVRNPWGHGEFQSGKWDDDGPMWDKFPLVKINLKHEAKDDGKENISLFH